jgi:hypothetical protein
MRKLELFGAVHRDSILMLRRWLTRHISSITLHRTIETRDPRYWSIYTPTPEDTQTTNTFHEKSKKASMLRHTTKFIFSSPAVAERIEIDPQNVAFRLGKTETCSRTTSAETTYLDPLKEPYVTFVFHYLSQGRPFCLLVIDLKACKLICSLNSRYSRG